MKKSEFLAYESDASQIKGNAREVLFPKTISETQEIVRNDSRICIRGGGSGLVGGAVPQNGQDIVLDTSKLRKIGSIDLTRGTIEVEAGVVLQDLQDYLRKYNLEFPINPLSKDICTIGGMVATNASCPRGIKYRDTSEWIRWIEIIDSEGKIDRKGKTEISDYAGMEGITGIIIKICLNLIKIKKRTATLVKISDSKKITGIIKHLKKDSNISMMELFDRRISRGIGLEDKYHIIIEYENDSGIFKDEEYERLLQKREEAYKFLMIEGYTRIEDPKIIMDRFMEFIEWFEIRNIPFFASLGTGILHPAFYKAQEKYIPDLMKIVKKHSGKITSQYGIGILKKEYVEYNDKNIIQNIKKRTDIQNKFNIGKII